jgi:hypothetical protein
MYQSIRIRNQFGNATDVSFLFDTLHLLRVKLGIYEFIVTWTVKEQLPLYIHVGSLQVRITTRGAAHSGVRQVSPIATIICSLIRPHAIPLAAETGTNLSTSWGRTACFLDACERKLPNHVGLSCTVETRLEPVLPGCESSALKLRDHRVSCISLQITLT